MTDLSQVSDADLQAYSAGKYKDISDSGLKIISQLHESFPSRPGDNAGALNAAAYGFSGGSVPFGNVITSGIGAGIAKAASPITGDTRSIGELYDQAQADTKTTQTENPVSTFAGNVAGIGATIPLAINKAITGTIPAEGLRGAINAIPKGLATVGDFVRGSPVAADASLGEKAASLGLQSLKSAAVAAPVGAAYGAGDADAGNRLAGAESGAGLAAASGAALPVVGAAASALQGAIAPKVNDAVQLAASYAQKHGIPLSLDQLSKSATGKYLADVSGKVPFSGGEQFAAKQQGAFNKAVLKTVGVEADKATPDVVDQAFTTIGNKFDQVLAGKTLTVSPDHLDSLDKIVDNASGALANDKVSALKKTIDSIKSNISPDGTISGEKIGDIRSTLSTQIKRADPGIKDYLGDVMDQIMDISTDGNPESKALLTEAKYQYKNLKTLEPILAKTTDGDISPALLKNRVIQSYGAKNMATDNAGDLGELSRVGDLIKKKVGESGTTERALAYGALALPGAIIGGYETPGGVVNKLGGAAIGGATTLAAAKGFQKYNNSQALALKAFSPAEIARLPANAGTVGGILTEQMKQRMSKK